MSSAAGENRTNVKSWRGGGGERQDIGKPDPGSAAPEVVSAETKNASQVAPAKRVHVENWQVGGKSSSETAEVDDAGKSGSGSAAPEKVEAGVEDAPQVAPAKSVSVNSSGSGGVSGSHTAERVDTGKPNSVSAAPGKVEAGVCDSPLVAPAKSVSVKSWGSGKVKAERVAKAQTGVEATVDDGGGEDGETPAPESPTVASVAQPEELKAVIAPNAVANVKSWDKGAVQRQGAAAGEEAGGAAAVETETAAAAPPSPQPAQRSERSESKKTELQPVNLSAKSTQGNGEPTTTPIKKLKSSDASNLTDTKSENGLGDQIITETKEDMSQCLPQVRTREEPGVAGSPAASTDGSSSPHLKCQKSQVIAPQSNTVVQRPGTKKKHKVANMRRIESLAQPRVRAKPQAPPAQKQIRGGKTAEDTASNSSGARNQKGRTGRRVDMNRISRLAQPRAKVSVLPPDEKSDPVRRSHISKQSIAAVSQRLHAQYSEREEKLRVARVQQAELKRKSQEATCSFTPAINPTKRPGQAIGDVGEDRRGHFGSRLHADATLRHARRRIAARGSSLNARAEHSFKPDLSLTRNYYESKARRQQNPRPREGDSEEAYQNIHGKRMARATKDHIVDYSGDASEAARDVAADSVAFEDSGTDSDEDLSCVDMDSLSERLDQAYTRANYHYRSMRAKHQRWAAQRLSSGPKSSFSRPSGALSRNKKWKSKPAKKIAAGHPSAEIVTIAGNASISAPAHDHGSLRYHGEPISQDTQEQNRPRVSGRGAQLALLQRLEVELLRTQMTQVLGEMQSQLADLHHSAQLGQENDTVYRESGERSWPSSLDSPAHAAHAVNPEDSMLALARSKLRCLQQRRPQKGSMGGPRNAPLRPSGGTQSTSPRLRSRLLKPPGKKKSLRLLNASLS